MKQLLRLLALKIICPNYIRLFPPRLSVASGPFAGMRYLTKGVGSSFAAKILGTYEKELHSIILRILSLHFVRVINIGAGEGYYAVGMAFTHPSQPEVIAFEADAVGRRRILWLALHNEVRPIAIHGLCNAGDLAAALREGVPTLVVCDVEGDEKNLLNLEAVPSLREAWILVEVHDFVERGMGDLLKRRFHGTHWIREIWSEARNAADLPWSSRLTDLLPLGVRLRAMNEGRPERMRWFWMEPRICQQEPCQPWTAD